MIHICLVNEIKPKKRYYFKRRCLHAASALNRSQQQIMLHLDHVLCGLIRDVKRALCASVVKYNPPVKPVSCELELEID